MSDTPRTDDFYYERSRIPSDRAWLKYARQLERELAAANAKVERFESALWESTEWFERAPCKICGYNKAGYYDSNRHPCAKKYHAAIDAAKGKP